MSTPLRENLEVYSDGGGQWIRCTCCSQVLCRLGEDWRKGCTRKSFPPTNAGPLMSILVGHYLLEKLYCPACAALLESDMVKEGLGG